MLRILVRAGLTKYRLSHDKYQSRHWQPMVSCRRIGSFYMLYIREGTGILQEILQRNKIY